MNNYPRQQSFNQNYEKPYYTHHYQPPIPPQPGYDFNAAYNQQANEPCSSGFSRFKKPKYDNSYKSSSDHRFNNKSSRSSSSSYKNKEKKVDFTLDDENEEDKEGDDNGEEVEEVNYQGASYLQATLIPIYYSKDENVCIFKLFSNFFALHSFILNLESKTSKRNIKTKRFM
jgi:hypothetical protein